MPPIISAVNLSVMLISSPNITAKSNAMKLAPVVNPVSRNALSFLLLVFVIQINHISSSVCITRRNSNVNIHNSGLCSYGVVDASYFEPFLALLEQIRLIYEPGKEEIA